ncbi:50S ribosomal protein L9 [Rickettsiales bacterium]|nr:50S ribosomal protein L9 [Rickettsiales bacterium]
MEVILLEKVEKLGAVGDVVSVKNGFGRNFLIPRKKALRATNENKAFFEKQRSEIEKENAEKLKVAEKLAKDVSEKFFIINCQAGEDGRLFGSVAARDIAKVISDTGVKVSRSQITLDKPIKYTGINLARIALHPEVIVTAYINVARTEGEAEEAKKEFLNPTKKEEVAASPVESEEVAAKEDSSEEVKADDKSAESSQSDK